MACPTPASSSDTAAWVQAWGSILAILASAGVAIWQARTAQKLTLFTIEQQRKADDMRVADALLEIATNALKLQKHMAMKLDSRQSIMAAAEDQLPFDMPEVYAYERALDRIELHQLPSNLVSLALIVAATFRQFRIKLDMLFDRQRYMDSAMFDDFLVTMKDMQKSMSETVADLEKQVEQMRHFDSYLRLGK
ncbi:hypothetical protein [Paraburkholderia fungorum]|uniref:hypothetical protein n=1 Tax=Paraburkholderia fungorum TaxID=134537 RepID=UPI001C1EBA24|nr:hypothetical protein [Paraburkholderia fungorum]MBU7435846.1 hypothetical protein [Paraburkholderia fungorum]